LAAALLAVPAAHAADAPAGRPAKPAPGPVMDAVQSLAREMQADQDPLLPLPAQLERSAAFRPTPDTAAKLRAVFGTDRPYTVERRPAKAGRVAYQARLQPLHYKGEAGARTDWDEALIDFDMDAAGKAVAFKGHWNTVSTEDPTMRLNVQGITLAGRQQRSRDHLWFGNGQLRIAGVRGDTPQSPNAGMGLSMNDLRMDWRTVEHPKTIDMQFQQRIGSIEAAGEKIDDVRFDLRIVNVDRAAMVALQAANARQRQQLKGMTPEQQLAAMKPMFHDLGKAAIARGSSIEIDEISARYRGNKASIRGRIGLAGAVESDLDNLKTLVKKVVASFEIRVPVAMVRDIAGVVAAKQSKQQGAAANGMGAAQMGQTMTDVVVGKLVGGGYARIENDVLVSKVEFRDGELTANGKKVELPKPPAGGAPPAPPQRSSLPPNALQARRIEDSCRLPDFPDEVIGPDKALTAGFAWRVDETGKVENARVTATSGYPAWDQSMVEVLGQCRYIPALQGGKAIGLNIDWSVTRLKGGPRSPVPTP
jgi:uncharacterized protein YdgA (DUF945 family)